jgi:hypothetical protein
MQLLLGFVVRGGSLQACCSKVGGQAMLLAVRALNDSSECGCVAAVHSKGSIREGSTARQHHSWVLLERFLQWHVLRYLSQALQVLQCLC